MLNSLHLLVAVLVAFVHLHALLIAFFVSLLLFLLVVLLLALAHFFRFDHLLTCSRAILLRLSFNDLSNGGGRVSVEFCMLHGPVQLQVERLLDLALRRHGQIEAYVLERAQLVKAAVPRVKDFVEFDQLFGQLVDFVASCGREIAI